MIVEICGQTDRGQVRRANEDNFLVLDLSAKKWCVGSEAAVSIDALRRIEVGGEGLVLVVSDGMGGALAGDVASRMAVEIVRDWFATNGKESSCEPDELLVECLRVATEFANLAINRRSLEDLRFSGMGATFTGAAVCDKQIGLVQVGDSRAYLMRGNSIKLVTKDQSLVQQLVDVGTISEAEAETHMFRNVILQALGAQKEVVPVTGNIGLRRNDTLLLCSDGLSGKLRAEEMQQIVHGAKDNLVSAAAALINEANRRGGEDNITVVLARFSGADLSEPHSDTITIETTSVVDDPNERTLDGTTPSP